MSNKKRIKSGIKKTTIAIGCAFVGPVLFVLGSGQPENDYQSLLWIFVGGLIMLCSIVIGILGLRDIVGGFFEKN